MEISSGGKSAAVRHNKNNRFVAISVAAFVAMAGGVLGAVTANHQGTDDVRPSAVDVMKAPHAQMALAHAVSSRPAVHAAPPMAAVRLASVEPAPVAKTVAVPLPMPVIRASFAPESLTPQPASVTAPANIPTFRVGQQLSPAVAVEAPPAAAGIDLQQLVSEHRCLSEVLYYEARGESKEGKLAVAEVVFHRMRLASYPHSICGIVHQGAPSKCQFSFACKDATALDQKNARDWRNAQSLAAKILGGTVPLGDLTGEATHFHAVSADAEIWPGLVRTVQIGNTVFFREPSRTHAS